VGDAVSLGVAGTDSSDGCPCHNWPGRVHMLLAGESSLLARTGAECVSCVVLCNVLLACVALCCGVL
jgi:hypothetical protein